MREWSSRVVMCAVGCVMLAGVARAEPMDVLLRESGAELGGLDLLPAASGVARMAALGTADRDHVWQGLVEAARGADLLVVECSCPDELATPGHLTPDGVGRLCAESRPARVVLTHLYPPAAALDALAVRAG